MGFDHHTGFFICHVFAGIVDDGVLCVVQECVDEVHLRFVERDDNDRLGSGFWVPGHLCLATLRSLRVTEAAQDFVCQLLGFDRVCTDGLIGKTGCFLHRSPIGVVLVQSAEFDGLLPYELAVDSAEVQCVGRRPTSRRKRQHRLVVDFGVAEGDQDLVFAPEVAEELQERDSGSIKLLEDALDVLSGRCSQHALAWNVPVGLVAIAVVVVEILSGKVVFDIAAPVRHEEAGRWHLFGVTNDDAGPTAAESTDGVGCWNLGCLVEDDEVERDGADGEQSRYRIWAHQQARHDVGERLAVLPDECPDGRLLPTDRLQFSEEILGFADFFGQRNPESFLALAYDARDPVPHQFPRVLIGAIEVGDAEIVLSPIEVVDVAGFEALEINGFQEPSPDSLFEIPDREGPIEHPVVKRGETALVQPGCAPDDRRPSTELEVSVLFSAVIQPSWLAFCPGFEKCPFP